MLRVTKCYASEMSIECYRIVTGHEGRGAQRHWESIVAMVNSISQIYFLSTRSTASALYDRLLKYLIALTRSQKSARQLVKHHTAILIFIFCRDYVATFKKNFRKFSRGPRHPDAFSGRNFDNLFPLERQHFTLKSNQSQSSKG